ncbi:hypothetical protein TrST_g13492 [Triparma strigata]|uniref:Uncharacterized protein n=1 Tax=Triparma strigata TaxID=1606541 RepID=A0A9W7BCU1_9STRA|nr:hypothetical protein TrST_g13492 [Triparma strigata]
MASLLSNTTTTTSRHHIRNDLAQLSSVYYSRQLLSLADIEHLQSIQQKVHNSGHHSNEQNASHHNPNHKHCTFMSRPAGPDLPANPLRVLAPQTLGKLLRFGQSSWLSADWSNPDGPLSSVLGPGSSGGGVGNLSIRIAEHWHYDVGGHLDNDLHFDQGSVITIVTALNDDFTGGVFRTFEANNSHLSHPLATGDSCCFVSHKYHNVTPVLSGFRESLVIELWEGGIATHGR